MATSELTLPAEHGMSTPTTASRSSGTPAAEGKRIVNDMSIQVATVNGSGSQSANTVLLRTIFQMGVPVSGKNLFPSNIEGLPTWYTIRASKDGYIARKKEIDFLVAMNAQTGREDVMALAPGAVVLYDEPLNLSSLRSDLVFYAVPFDKITASVCHDAKLRKLVKNMVYVGVVARLLGLDVAQMEIAIRKQFGKKVKAAELNVNAAHAGYDYAANSLAKHDPYWIRADGRNPGQDHHRRQLGSRYGRDVRRGHGGDLVSDYSVFFALRNADRIFEGISRRTGRQGHVCRSAGRG